jgi:hypothetical protein
MIYLQYTKDREETAILQRRSTEIFGNLFVVFSDSVQGPMQGVASGT